MPATDGSVAAVYGFSRLGQTLDAISDASGQPQKVDSLLLHRSPRWQVRDDARFGVRMKGSREVARP